MKILLKIFAFLDNHKDMNCIWREILIMFDFSTLISYPFHTRESQSHAIDQIEIFMFLSIYSFNNLYFFILSNIHISVRNIHIPITKLNVHISTSLKISFQYSTFRFLSLFLII